MSGKFALSERVLLEVEIIKGAERARQAVALNDAVISRGEISRLIRLRTRVNGAPLTEFNADGLVVAISLKNLFPGGVYGLAVVQILVIQLIFEPTVHTRR